MEAIQNYMPTSAQEAKSLGIKYYFTGVPCKHGHFYNRYTSNKCCVKCRMIITAKHEHRIKTDIDYLNARREIQRKSKAKSRSTQEGKKAHYEANKKYIEKNRDKVNKYYQDKAKEDHYFRAARTARSLLRKVLVRANLKKEATCVELLGYDRFVLKDHIEKQFTKGMSWDKFGSEIHIDHIIPIAHFLKNGETDPKVINALSNLRPMWAKDNILKSDNINNLL